MPAVRFKALRGVVGKPAFYFTVDRNTVVVVESDQLTQAQGASQ